MNDYCNTSLYSHFNYVLPDKLMRHTAAAPLVLVFGGQAMHVVCCGSGWYVPFLQGMQLFCVPFKKVPGWHTGNVHSSTVAAPGLCVVRPVGHPWQAACTPIVRYVPLGHGSHFPSTPNCLPEPHSSRHSCQRYSN